MANPTPREHETPTGDIVASSHWLHGVRDDTVVPADSRPLYDLLKTILGDVSLPDCFPARLATEADDLVEAVDLCRDINRGTASIGTVGYGMSYCQRAADAIEAHRDRDPLQLVAVGCSSSKDESDGKLPAADRYEGGYWKNKREYGEVVGDEWGIISAQYGLLRPDDEIPHYERTVSNLKGIPVDSTQRLPNGDSVDTLLDQWALNVYNGLSEWVRGTIDAVDPRDIELEILLGKSYQEPLQDRGVFQRLRGRGDVAVSFPFREIDYSDGGGIGTQRSWMCEQVEQARNEQATDAEPQDAPEATA
jgi:hypothetical protein